MKNTNNPTTPSKNLHNIYKLEQLRNSTPKTTLTDYKKRAKAKYAQSTLVRHLMKLDSPYKDKYEDTMLCSGILQQQGDKIQSRYCKHRWCRICNRIRTGKLINGYQEALNNMNDKQFVTLTVKNVPAENLRSTIEKMIKDFRLIQELRRKKKQKAFNCIRKLECTYNPDSNTYHPHIHVIIEGFRAGSELIFAWLKRNEDSSIKGQDQKKCYDAIELFKYFAKLTSKSKSDTKYYKGKKIIQEEWHYPEALDIIFRAIEGLRIIQPMGNIKMVNDEIEELEIQVVERLEEKFTLWIYRGSDWIDTDTADMLTGYTPSEKEYNYQRRIRKLHDLN